MLDDKTIEDQYLNPRVTPRSMTNVLLRRALAEYVREKAKLLSGRVLDVGCGKSPYRSVLTSVAEYVGMDVFDSRYDKLQVGVWFDGSEFPLQDGSFDSVLCTEVLEHVPDPRLHVSEAARVLKKGGRILLTTPFIWPIHDEPHDYQRFTHYGLKMLLGQAGFEEIEITSFGGWHTAIAQMLACYCRRGFSRTLWGKRIATIVGFTVLFFVLKLLPLLDNLSDDEQPQWTLGYGVVARKA